MASTAQQAKSTARQVEDSKPVEGFARFGFTARGVVYLLIGLLAAQVAVGGGGKADRHGALAAIKEQPLGATLLLLLTVGFAGYGGWRLLQAAVGQRDADAGWKRTMKRLGSLARGLLYASFAVSTLRFITSDAGSDKTKPFTARLMAVPSGQMLVGLLGLAVIGGGLYMAYRGLARKFLKRLALGSTSALTRKLTVGIGVAGLIGHGLVFCLLGGFLVQAAVTFDPAKAKGMDAALKTLASADFGPFLLLAAALGLFAYGAWSFVEARYRTV